MANLLAQSGNGTDSKRPATQENGARRGRRNQKAFNTTGFKS